MKVSDPVMVRFVQGKLSIVQCTNCSNCECRQYQTFSRAVLVKQILNCHPTNLSGQNRANRRGAGNFSLHHHVQNDSGAHPASYLLCTRGTFPWVKAAGAWSWPLASI